MVGFNTFTSSDSKNKSNTTNNSGNTTTFFHTEKQKKEEPKPKFLSDEDLCRRVSNLPDRVLLKGFDKPLEEELAALPYWQKLALRAWWFNPDAWPELPRETKLEFTRYLLKNQTSQHQIAQELRSTVVEVCKTLCGYNAVKGVCTKTFGHHDNDSDEQQHLNSTNSTGSLATKNSTSSSSASKK